MFGEEFFPQIKTLSYAVFLGGTRMLGLTFLFPVFVWGQIRGVMRTSIAYALAAPTIYAVFMTIQHQPPMSTGLMLSLVVKEAAIGLALGLALAIPFWAAQAAGDIVDFYRGASAPNLFDPVHAAETSVLGNVFYMTALIVFVSAGGIPLIVEMVMRTQASWPVLELWPPIPMSAIKPFLVALMKSFTWTLVLAAPLMIGMALTDLTLVFTVRGARQFQIYDLTLSARGLVVALLAPVYFMFYVSYFADSWKMLQRAFDIVFPR